MAHFERPPDEVRAMHKRLLVFALLAASVAPRAADAAGSRATGDGKRAAASGEAAAPSRSGHPDAAWLASPNFVPGRASHDFVALQVVADGDAALERFRDAASLTSAHYLVRAGGELVQLVEEQDSALRAGCVEASGLLVALEARDGALGDELYRAAADLVRFLTERYGMPLDRQHLLGAGESPRECAEPTDDGPAIDWPRLLAPDGGALRANGRVRGFTYYGSDPADTSKRIAGAALRVAETGATTTSSAAGYYEFSLPPATYTVQASAAGYQDATITRAVPDGADVWGSIAMTAAPAADTTPPAVAIESPAASASVDGAQVTVKGSASDNAGAISAVRFVLNGAAPVEKPVSGGRFEFGATLQPGDNTLRVEATDAAGNVGSAQAGVRLSTGISGVVVEAADRERRLSGAVIVLRAAGGEALGDTTSGADGSFRLDCAPGSYTLRASADGFAAAEQAATVGAESRTQVTLALYLEGNQPTFAFTIPEDGARVSFSPITVSGTCLGFQPSKIEVNGVRAVIGEGTFEATVELAEGANTLTAIATGEAGETLTAALAVTYQRPESSGIDGPEPLADGACGCSAGAEPLALAALLGLLALIKRRPCAR